MLYYHATTEQNFYQMLEDGVVKPGFDGLVYLADSDLNARKFICLRVPREEPIYVLEIDMTDDSKVEETFDHSYSFFQCKSYGYPEEISMDQVKSVLKYT